MAVGLITRGPNSFALNVPAGTSTNDVILKLVEVLPAYGWDVHDVNNAVFRSLNADDVTFKYLRLSQVTDSTGVYVYTDVYHSWDAVTGIGTHQTGHTLTGQQRADYTKAAFYLTHNTQQTTVYVYANARWCLLSSSVGGSGFGAMTTTTSFTIYLRWNDSNDYNYVTVKSGPHEGASGCVELLCPTTTANQTSKFVWLHTGRMFEDRVAHFSGESTLLNTLDYWDMKEPNEICKIPQLDDAVTISSSAPLIFTSPLIANIAELRKPAHPKIPSVNEWSGYNITYDVGVRTAGGIPIGKLYGLKLAQSTGLKKSTTDSSIVRIGPYMATDLNGTPVKHWYIPTYTKYDSYNQSKACRYCTVYSSSNVWEYTPGVLIPA